MVNNRTFCALLAAFLMLTGGIVHICREDHQGGMALSGDAVEAASGQAGWISPLNSWNVLEGYGAQYDDALSQWSGRSSVLLDAEAGETVVSPMNGTVEKIENDGGGSWIVIAEADMKVEIRTVTGICVFEGSGVRAGDILGRAQGAIELRTWKNGECVNPEAWLQQAA